MFLDNLLEAGIVELCKFGQVVHIGNDIAQIFLEQHEVIFGRNIVFFINGSTGSLTGPSSWASSLQPSNDFIDLLFAGLDPSHDFPRLHPLEGPNLIKLSLQLGNKSLLVIFVPRASGRMGYLWGWSTFVRGLECVLEVLIRDVVIEIIFQEGSPQLLAKAMFLISVSGQCVERMRGEYCMIPTPATDGSSEKMLTYRQLLTARASLSLHLDSHLELCAKHALRT